MKKILPNATSVKYLCNYINIYFLYFIIFISIVIFSHSSHKRKSFSFLYISAILYNKLMLFKFEQNQLPKATICNTLYFFRNTLFLSKYCLFLIYLIPFTVLSALHFLFVFLTFYTNIDFILLYFTDLQHAKVCPEKISASGTFFFNFDEYLILQKSVARNEWDGDINKLLVCSGFHVFTLKLLTAASVIG